MNRGFVVWLTGLPGSGKTTIARILEKILRESGMNVEVLDGDEIRKNLNPDLGFSKEDRETHIKRVVYLSKLLARNDVAVIVSLISPYRAVREYARKELRNFVEVWVKCSLQTCINRDPKGLFKRALNGEIKNLTGLQDTYEEPLNPELIVDTEMEKPEESTMRVIRKLRGLGYITN